MEIREVARAARDYIDLYQAHWGDRETPPDETLRAFDDLVSQRKVRYLGASNYPAWRLTAPSGRATSAAMSAPAAPSTGSGQRRD